MAGTVLNLSLSFKNTTIIFNASQFRFFPCTPLACRIRRIVPQKKTTIEKNDKHPFQKQLQSNIPSG